MREVAQALIKILDFHAQTENQLCQVERSGDDCGIFEAKRCATAFGRPLGCALGLRLKLLKPRPCPVESGQQPAKFREERVRFFKSEQFHDRVDLDVVLDQEDARKSNCDIAGAVVGRRLKMKREFGVFVCLLALLLPGAVFAQTPDRVIPEGTEFQLSLSEPLSSKLNDVGDEVYATIRRDVVVDGRTILPKGTEVIGRVTLAKAAGRPFKGGRLHVTFERVRLDGQEQRLAVVVRSAADFSRDEKVKASSEGTLTEGTSGGDLLRNVGTAAGIGSIGVTIAILTSIKDRTGEGYSSIGRGGAVAGASILAASVVVGVVLTKGKEVRLEPGAIIRVRLERPLSVG